MVFNGDKKSFNGTLMDFNGDIKGEKLMIY